MVRPHLFLAFDGNHPTLPTWRHQLQDVDEIRVGRGRKREFLRERDGDCRCLILRFPDPWMSSDHARIRRTKQDLIMTDPGSKNGSYLNGVRQQHAVLRDGDLLRFGRTFFVYRDAHPALPDAPRDLVADLDAPPGFATMLVPLGQGLVAFAEAASAGRPLLITGELGTGKKLLARSGHALSGREGAFVVVGPGDSRRTRLPARLWGDGSSPGAVHEARDGTLYIDELSNLPAAAQRRLADSLTGGEIASARDGSTSPMLCRVIAATTQEPDHLVVRGNLDPDLFARFSDAVCRLPALRQRREDLGLLVATMLADYVSDGEVKFSADAVQALLRYPWPRNLHELEGCIGTVLALRDSAMVELEHLPPELRRDVPSSNAPGGDTIDTVDLTEKDLRKRAQIISELRAKGGHMPSNAAMVKQTRNQFQRWLSRTKLSFDRSSND